MMTPRVRPRFVRLPDWRARLFAHVETVRRQPFAYGTNDCALWVAGAVAAMTGTDPAAPFRGQYASLRQGLARLNAEGYADHVDLLAALLDEIDPPRAEVGDIAVLTADGGTERALGLVGGPHILVVGPRGLGTVPLSEAIRVFRP